MHGEYWHAESEDPIAEGASVEVVEVLTMDGVKYRLADQSWLLIRPSGTEPGPSRVRPAWFSNPTTRP